MRSTRAAYEPGVRRRGPGAPEGPTRALNTTERLWLLEQLIQRRSADAVGEPAADAGGTSDMNGKLPVTHEAPAAPPPVRRATETEPAPVTEPAAAAVRPTLAAIGAAARAAHASAAAAATHIARSAHRATPRADVTPYRAVFACAMNAQDAPDKA